MAPSFWQIIIVVVLILVLFGGLGKRGKISGMMSELAQGIKGFKKGMSEDDKQVEGAASQSVDDEKAATGAAAPDESTGKNTAS